MFKNKIYLIPFPFNDINSSKVRPALVLTEPIGKYQEVIIAYISSQINNYTEPSDIFFENNYLELGLIVPSVLKLHKIVTVPKTSLLKQLGSLTLELEKEVENKIQLIFGI